MILFHPRCQFIVTLVLLEKQTLKVRRNVYAFKDQNNGIVAATVRFCGLLEPKAAAIEILDDN